MTREELETEYASRQKRVTQYNTDQLSAEVRKMEDDLQLGPRYGGQQLPHHTPQILKFYSMKKENLD